MKHRGAELADRLLHRVLPIALLLTLATATAAGAQWTSWWLPLADDFLGNADFLGVPILAPPSPMGTESSYNGFLTVTNLERTLVAGLLPPGFQLAVNISFYLPDKHPVLLLFGDQTDGAAFLGSTVTPFPPIDRGHYSELILAIPYVQSIGTFGWHTYVVRMYLDNPIAVAGGGLYGYAKQFGCLDWRGSTVKVWQAPAVCPGPNAMATTQLLEADFWHSGPWYPGPAAAGQIPNFTDMVGMVTARVLGRSDTGASICSHFEWNFDDAWVAKALTTHRFESPFHSSMGAWPGLGNLSNVAEGAIEVRGVRWRLGPTPVPCGFP